MIIALLVCGVGSLAVASDSNSFVGIRALPGANLLSSQPSVSGKDFRLHVFRAKSANREVVETPAHLFDVFSAAGSWLSPDPAKVPPFTEPLPMKVRNNMQIFYNETTDWLVIPRSLVLWYASGGADGSISLEFVAPSNLDARWVIVNVEGGCYGCMLNDAAGFIPAATLIKAGYESGLGYTPPNVKLDPRPSVFTHPDACTALLVYSREKTLIHGAVVMFTDKNGRALGVESLYVGLPANEAYLGSFIVNTFLKTQMTRPFYLCAETASKS